MASRRDHRASLLALYNGHTFELNTIPQPCEAHELAILALGEVRYLLLATVLLQPLVEALCHNDAALLLLHGGPHAAVLEEGVVAAVDRLHLGAVVGVALCPEGHEA
jgi:hypothetical protein